MEVNFLEIIWFTNDKALGTMCYRLSVVYNTCIVAK